MGSFLYIKLLIIFFLACSLADNHNHPHSEWFCVSRASLAQQAKVSNNITVYTCDRYRVCNKKHQCCKSEASSILSNTSCSFRPHLTLNINYMTITENFRVVAYVKVEMPDKIPLHLRSWKHLLPHYSHFLAKYF